MTRRLTRSLGLAFAVAALAAPAALAYPVVPGEEGGAVTTPVRYPTSHKVKVPRNRPCQHIVAKCAVPQ